MDEYYFLPKELLTPEYSGYSLQTKLLFSIIITEAETVKSITDMSKLINDIGARKLSTIYQNAHRELNESEGA